MLALQLLLSNQMWGDAITLMEQSQNQVHVYTWFRLRTKLTQSHTQTDVL